MIHVIATIEVTAGRRDDLIAEMAKVVPLVQDEDGCLEYGPALDVETNIGAQPAVRQNVITMMEKWESLEALEQHLVAPHMMEYRERVKEMVQGVSIQVLEPA